MPTPKQKPGKFGVLSDVIGDILGLPGRVQAGGAESGALGAAKGAGGALSDTVADILGSVGDSIRPDGKISILRLLNAGGVRTREEAARAQEAEMKDVQLQAAKQALGAARIKQIRDLQDLPTEEQQSVADILGQAAGVESAQAARAGGADRMSAIKAGIEGQDKEVAPYGIGSKAIKAGKAREADNAAAFEAMGAPPALAQALSQKLGQKAASKFLQGQVEKSAQLIRDKDKAAAAQEARNNAPTIGKKKMQEFERALASGNQDEIARAGAAVLKEAAPTGSTTTTTFDPQSGKVTTSTGTGTEAISATTTDAKNKLLADQFNSQKVLRTSALLRRAIGPNSLGWRSFARGSIQDLLASGFISDAALQDLQGSIDPTLPAEQTNRVRFQIGRLLSYDPKIPATETARILLTLEFARMYNGGKLSDIDYKIAENAVGGQGVWANPQSLDAKLDTLEAQARATMADAARGLDGMKQLEKKNPMLATVQRMATQAGYTGFGTPAEAGAGGAPAPQGLPDPATATPDEVDALIQSGTLTPQQKQRYLDAIAVRAQGVRP